MYIHVLRPQTHTHYLAITGERKRSIPGAVLLIFLTRYRRTGGADPSNQSDERGCSPQERFCGVGTFFKKSPRPWRFSAPDLR